MKRIMTGVEFFKEIIDNNYYYVDKTNLINDVLKEKLVLYTRPRRFGKTLNMTMLKCFFSVKEKDNAYLFDGLNISKNKEAMKHLGKYPVIFVTFKDLRRNNMNDVKKEFFVLIQSIIGEYIELYNSDKLDIMTRININKYVENDYNNVDLENALYSISKALKQYYGSDVIILIDEYDVPLQSAYINGYYDEMVNFMRNVLSKVLKSNDALYKGVLTGCLRISKESIFTGLNNFKVRSLVDDASSSYFGFTQNEIDSILEYYNLTSYRDEIKEWYDGYMFGSSEIYNPWSTLMYVQDKLTNNTKYPVSYWANSSGNDLVMTYIEKANNTMYEEFEGLINSKPLTKRLKLELTYKDMDNINNVYSFLLSTGYLKCIDVDEDENYTLVIPNKEVRKIYENTFMEYFRDYTDKRRPNLVDALVKGEEEKANTILNDILIKSISYFDSSENFYHGFLTGLLAKYGIESNIECGDGRPDIIILPNNITNKYIIFELKYSSNAIDLVNDSRKAVKQIIDKRYIEGLTGRTGGKVIGYGISFYKKRCYILKA